MSSIVKTGDDDNDTVTKKPAKKDEILNVPESGKKPDDNRNEVIKSAAKKEDNHEVPKSSIIIENSDDEIIMPNYEGHFAASEIAGLIGKNKYVSKKHALCKLLNKDREFSSLIEQIKKETNNKTELLVTDYVKEVSTDIKTIIDESSNRIEMSTNENCDDFNNFIDNQIEETISKLKRTNKLPNVYVKRIRKSIRMRIQTGRGVKLEKKALDKLETDSQISITRRNSTVYKQKYELYSITGRVDGIDSKNQCVIEMKNRLKYVDKVREHDFIQCVIYMQLTGLKKCILVECFPDGQRRETSFDWDEELFKEIDKKLCELVLEIRKLTKARITEIILRPKRNNFY